MSEAETLPQHVAIIMDGNGRWAEKRYLPRVFGHRSGVDALRKAVQHSGKRGIDFLTLFAFSSENWNRPEEEVGFLMNLLRIYIEKETDFLNKNNVRVRFIGKREGLPSDIQNLMDQMIDVTSGNTGLTLSLAVNYGSHNEILDAFYGILQNKKTSNMSKTELKEAFEQNLLTCDLPDPDLLIRTAGEKRISNFLLWQIAYSELYFTDVLWPDFDEAAYDAALSDYATRERRYGALG
ncbi:MAG: isoprenyl transferase [Pseudomonadota bacterium]